MFNSLLGVRGCGACEGPGCFESMMSLGDRSPMNAELYCRMGAKKPDQ